MRFDRMYRDHALAVTRLAFLLVGSRAVAEELAQDAFLRLYEHMGTVDNPPGFVRTAVVRLALTWQDRRRMEAARLTVVGLVSSRPEPVPEPEIDETWTAIARLRPERRAVLVLRFYADMAFDEIGDALGCSPATARSRTRRALADLRKELDHEA